MHGYVGANPRESHLFFFTAFIVKFRNPGIGSAGDWVLQLGEPRQFGLRSGAFATALETPCMVSIGLILLLGVLITASGLQGEQPLVDRRMQTREVGKIDPQLRDKDWL
eukprot:TRINITY_DN139_c0_g1_i2.p2 TRINITY_DN139_c0_g1~~TRINITY_DN139_c0_g1_i2.p2  ORF type:complete len:109 (-),score=2.42 TRINITY_DN139_c0_g1_i2:228-554(-)